MKLRFLIMCVVLLAGLLPLFWLDPHVASLKQSLQLPNWTRSFIDPLRDFGSIFTQALILSFIFVLDPKRRAWVRTAILAIILTWLTTQAMKIGIGRLRPSDGGSSLEFSRDWTELFNDRRKSFPSGHTSCAFAVATSLAWTYPRARVGFYLLAFACAVTRVIDSRHFPTDAYMGAVLGIVVTRWIFLRAEAKGRCPATTIDC